MPEVEFIPIKDVNKTHKLMKNSEVKYRFVIDMTSIYK